MIYALFALALSLVGMVSDGNGNGNGDGGDDEPANNDEPNNQDGRGSTDDDGDDDDDGDGTGSRTDQQTEDVEVLRAELKRARNDAAKYRTERNTDRQKLGKLESQIDSISKALGVKEEDQDPEAIQKRLDSVTKDLRQERMRNAFNNVSAKLKADTGLAWAYLYSNGQLEDIEEDEMQTTLEERLKAALEDNPKLKAEPTTNGSRSSSDDTNNEPETKRSMNDLIRRGVGR